MTHHHRLIQRQIRKFFGAALPDAPGLAAFAQAVEQGYEQFDADRKLVERSMNLSVAELGEAMTSLKSQTLVAQRAKEEALEAKSKAEEANRLLAESLEQAHRLTREAEAAVIAKSAFLANMSHEIRTPLNAVLGMSSLLIGMGLTGEKLELAETIRSSGNSLLALLNDILDFSKIDSGHLELERQPFIVRECIESALEVLATRAAEKKLDLIYWIGNDVPLSLVGDVTRVRQVIVNLLGNAVKFTERGEIFLSVKRVGSEAEGGYRLHFLVHDSGIGIPPERMDRLFKSFSQVDTSTTRQYGGTGLGLAISKRLVELMGGRIWVESHPGRGSKFQFEIDLGSTAEDAIPTHQASELLRGKSLLIVDDNATQCRVLCLQAIAWGMTPRSTTRPMEAIGWIEQGAHFDLALVDCEMPANATLEFISDLRRTSPVERLPMIALRSLGNPVAAPDFGAVASVAKPIKPRSLLNALERVVHGQLAVSRPPLTAVDENIARHHPLRILLVEDNIVNQRVAGLMLKKLGYLTDFASNGLEGVRAVSQKSYDVVLMDLQMPELDGLGAAREICRRWSKSERPRIIAMTANVSPSDRADCLEAGMEDFVSKPVCIQELSKALRASPARRNPVIAHQIKL